MNYFMDTYVIIHMIINLHIFSFAFEEKLYTPKKKLTRLEFNQKMK